MKIIHVGHLRPAADDFGEGMGHEAPPPVGDTLVPALVDHERRHRGKGH